ncbi:MAG: SMC-Scp complex subunit ScpB [Actinomycetota bacterium]|nr:SMC-Scp complex subunit ScpB [Actinomycetota bacterium]
MEHVSRQALEAILFVVDEPVDVSTLTQVLEVGRAEVEAALRALAERLRDERRGFVLREVAGGWRLYTAPEAAPYVERWVLAGRSGRLTQAALETLAVIAYKQPISRQEIGEIRGVNADGAVRTLLARGLVEEVGRDPGPGRAVLYGTTTAFLEKVGLSDLDGLPPLTDFLPEAPAPDEPSDPVDLRAARQRLQAGRDLVTAGRPRWEPGGGGERGAGAEDAPARSEPDAASGTRDPDQDMDDLTAALERATRNAMAALEHAVSSADEHQDGVRGDDEGTP